MTLENPLTVLQNGKKFEKGEALVLKFLLPPIESDIFGYVDDLSGEVPFTLNYGECPMSPFYDLGEVEQEKYIRMNSDDIKTLNDNIDDETLRHFSIFTIICVISIDPHVVPGTPDFFARLKFCVISLLADDLIDAEEYYDESYDFKSMLRKTSALMAEAQQGNMEALVSFQRLFPPFEQLISATHFPNGIDQTTQEFNKSRYWVYKANLDLVSSQLIIFSRSMLEGYSRRGKMVLNGINKGIEGFCEIYAATEGIIVSQNIRETFFFKEMMDCFNIITGGINDIRGIVKDIKKNETLSSSILSWFDPKEGRDLRFCFKNTLDNINESYTMFNTMAKYLEDTYNLNQGLKEYIQLLKIVLDGHLFLYFGFSSINLRYGVGGTYYIDKKQS